MKRRNSIYTVCIHCYVLVRVYDSDGVNRFEFKIEGAKYNMHALNEILFTENLNISNQILRSVVSSDPFILQYHTYRWSFLANYQHFSYGCHCVFVPVFQHNIVELECCLFDDVSITEWLCSTDQLE